MTISLVPHCRPPETLTSSWLLLLVQRTPRPCLPWTPVPILVPSPVFSLSSFPVTHSSHLHPDCHQNMMWLGICCPPPLPCCPNLLPSALQLAVSAQGDPAMPRSLLLCHWRCLQQMAGAGPALQEPLPTPGVGSGGMLADALPCPPPSLGLLLLLTPRLPSCINYTVCLRIISPTPAWGFRNLFQCIWSCLWSQNKSLSMMDGVESPFWLPQCATTPALCCAGSDGQAPASPFPPVFQMVHLSLLLPLANTALGQCPVQVGGWQVPAACWLLVLQCFLGSLGIRGVPVGRSESLCAPVKQEDAHTA